jgi:TonB family protein
MVIMDALSFHERRLSRGELFFGLGGSVAAHVAIVAATLMLPLLMPRKTVQMPFYSVNLVSSQDFGAAGAAGSKKGVSSKSAETPKASDGEKAAPSSSRRSGSSSVVPVKRLQFDEPKTRSEPELKKLETKDAPDVAESVHSSVSIDKSLDNLIQKPKARPKPTPVQQESGKGDEKGVYSRDSGSGRAQKTSDGEKGAAAAGSSSGTAGSSSGTAGSSSGTAGSSSAGVGQGEGGAGAKTGPAGGRGGSPDGAASSTALRLYSTEVWNAVRRQWALPEFLKSQKLEASLLVVVRRDGKVMSIQFEKKSGQSLYDESTERAVRKADPLPPFPQIYSPSKVEFHFTFRPEDLT